MRVAVLYIDLYAAVNPLLIAKSFSFPVFIDTNTSLCFNTADIAPCQKLCNTYIEALLFQTPEHLEIRGNLVGQKEFHATNQIKNWRHTIQSEKIQVLCPTRSKSSVSDNASTKLNQNCTSLPLCYKRFDFFKPTQCTLYLYVHACTSKHSVYYKSVVVEFCLLCIQIIAL